MTETKPVDEKAVFNTARRISDSTARDDYLNLACRGDQHAMQRILEMIAVHEQECEFLESSPLLEQTQIASHSVSERAGDTIGAYKLLQQIGEGGMGVVYLAEQKEPVKRRVALKIIKPGMDTRQVIARFEAERQALAMMNHPNIAKVLDAGETATGRPYFVMELVDGMPLTKYCDRERLTTGQRLKLFVPICQAVQHAHQKGIIHRDIKPSNILVTHYDGVPVPKVIDFGIAKATNQQLTEKTLFTSFGQLIGTPTYMSPEQAEMSGLDIDTRSDIYSLGVLLYELLTGNTPFEQRRLLDAGYAEMQRIIAEEDPPRPSAKLTTMGNESGDVASKRGTDSRKLTQTVRGELDWISMKALEKDRQRRYATAAGFAEDIERYMNDEAVQACPPSSIYLFRKFVRRNFKSLLVSAALLLALIASVFGVRTAREHDRELQQLRLEQGRLVVTEPDQLNVLHLRNPKTAMNTMDWSWRGYAPAGKEIEICFASSKIPDSGFPEDTYIWRSTFSADSVVGSLANGSLVRVALVKDTSRENDRWMIQMTQGSFKIAWPLTEDATDDRWSMTSLAGEDDQVVTRPVGESLVLVRHRLSIEETLSDGSTSSRIPVSEPLDGFMLWLELKDKEE